MDYATEELSKIEGIRFIGQAQEKAGVISFLVGDIHPYDMGMILDKLGVAVRRDIIAHSLLWTNFVSLVL